MPKGDNPAETKNTPNPFPNQFYGTGEKHYWHPKQQIQALIQQCQFYQAIAFLRIKLLASLISIIYVVKERSTNSKNLLHEWFPALFWRVVPQVELLHSVRLHKMSGLRCFDVFRKYFTLNSFQRKKKHPKTRIQCFPSMLTSVQNYLIKHNYCCSLSAVKSSMINTYSIFSQRISKQKVLFLCEYLSCCFMNRLATWDSKQAWYSESKSSAKAYTDCPWRFTHLTHV